MGDRFTGVVLRKTYLAACLVVLTLGCNRTGSSEQALAGDPSKPNCGFVVVAPPPSPNADACLFGELVAGPLTAVRTPGAPQTQTLDFNVSGDGSVCVRLLTEGVSSARIELDGSSIATPDRFKPGISVVETRTTIGAGAHSLSVRLTGAPSREVTIEVRHSSGISPLGEVAGNNEILRAFDLDAQPDLITPNGDGDADETTISVVADFSRELPGSAGNTRFQLNSEFAIINAQTCLEVRRLQVPILEIDVARAVSMAAVWNGRDASGSVVPDGLYFYQAALALQRATGSGNQPLDMATTNFQALRVGEVEEPIPPLAVGPAPTAPGEFSRALTMPPVTRVTQAELDAELALQNSQHAAAMDPVLWLQRYRDAASTEPTLALVPLLSDDGPIAGRHLRASTWSVSEILAGPAVGPTVQIHQPSVNGLVRSDGMLRGQSNSASLVVLSPALDVGALSLSHDVVSHTYGFGNPSGPDRWRFETGPEITRDEINQLLGTW